MFSPGNDLIEVSGPGNDQVDVLRRQLVMALRCLWRDDAEDREECWISRLVPSGVSITCHSHQLLIHRRA